MGSWRGARGRERFPWERCDPREPHALHWAPQNIGGALREELLVPRAEPTLSPGSGKGFYPLKHPRAGSACPEQTPACVSPRVPPRLGVINSPVTGLRGAEIILMWPLERGDNKRQRRCHPERDHPHLPSGCHRRVLPSVASRCPHSHPPSAAGPGAWERREKHWEPLK